MSNELILVGLYIQLTFSVALGMEGGGKQLVLTAASLTNWENMSGNRNEQHFNVMPLSKPPVATLMLLSCNTERLVAPLNSQGLVCVAE